MSQPSYLKLTRRTLLAGSAASAAAVALPIGIAGASSKQSTHAQHNCTTSVCADHHVELSNHLRQVLDSAYVDEHMKNTVLRTTVCPHCRVGIHPAPETGFTALAA